MKRVKNVLKRGIAIILASVILSFTVVSDYQDAENCYAMGMVDTAFLFYQSMIQTVLASMGYSFSTTADLSNATKGLENIVNSYKDVDSFADAFVLTQIFGAAMAAKVGLAIPITKPMVLFVQKYLTNVISSKSSYSGENDKSSTSSLITVDSIKTSYITDKFAGMPLMDPSYGGVQIALSSNVTNAKFLAVSQYLDVNGLLHVDYAVTTSNNYYIVEDDNYYYLYNGSNKISFIGNTITESVHNAIGKYMSPYYANVNNNGTSKTLENASYISLAKSKYKTVYTTLPVYSSYEHFIISRTNLLLYPIESKVYGNTSASATVPETVTVTDNSQTANIEQIVADAIAKNPAMTQEDIDAIVAAAIEKINSTTTDTGTTTDTPAIDLSDTNSLIKDVYKSIASLRELLISYTDKWTEGSSALKQEVEDISDQFKVVQGGGKNNNDENPKIWIPPGFFASKLLAPLMEYIGNPLSEITKFLNVIKNSLSGLPQLFDEAGKLYIGNIFTSMTSISSYVGQIAQAIGELPQAIAEAIEFPEINIPAIEIPPIVVPEIALPDIKVEIPTIEAPEIKIPEIKVPDINIEFPAIPNYLQVLTNILNAIQNIFVIDTVAVGKSVDDFNGIWDKHLPFIVKLKDIFSKVSFSSNYEYPVIKIGTPKIIKTFYQNDYIVLLDFKDYAYYMLWARNIIRAILWFGFAYSIFRHFRITFHVG